MKYLLILIFLLPQIGMAKLEWHRQYWNSSNNCHNNIYKRINCDDEGNCIALANDEGFCKVLQSVDQGETWKIIHNEKKDGDLPTPFRVRNMHYVDSEHLYIGYEGGYLKSSSDLCKTFDTVKFSTQYPIENIEMADANHGLAGTTQQLFITSDGWKTWKELKNLPQDYFIHVWMHDSLTFELSSVYSGKGTEHHKTTDGGKTWVTKKIYEEGYLRKFFYINKKIGWLAGFKRNGHYKQCTDVIFKTTDGGEHWEKKYEKDLKPIWGLQDIVFKNENDGVAVGQSGKILMTTDGGDSWAIDTLQKYAEYNGTGPATMVACYAGEIPILGTFGSGIYKLKDPSSVEQDNLVASKVSVYPNPFTEYVVIEFEIKRASEVKVEIFDLIGNKVEEETRYARTGLNKLLFTPAANQTGMYMYRIIIEGKLYTGSILKK